MENLLSNLLLTTYSDGAVRASYEDKTDTRGVMLADFIQGDIQGDSSYIIEILTALNEIEAGTRIEWEGTGNAFTLLINASGATLCFALKEFEDVPKEHLALEELKAALTKTLTFINATRKDEID